MSADRPSANEGDDSHIGNTDILHIAGIDILIGRMSDAMNSVANKKWYKGYNAETIDMRKISTEAYELGKLLGKNHKAKVLFNFDSGLRKWSFTENSVSIGGIIPKSPEYEVYNSISEGFETYRTSQVEKYNEKYHRFHGPHTEEEYLLLRDELSRKK